MTGLAFYDRVFWRRFGLWLGLNLCGGILSVITEAGMGPDYSGFPGGLGVFVIAIGLAFLAVRRIHAGCPWCDADWSAITWPCSQNSPPARCPECGINLAEPIPIRPTKSKLGPPPTWDDELG